MLSRAFFGATLARFCGKVAAKRFTCVDDHFDSSYWRGDFGPTPEDVEKSNYFAFFLQIYISPSLVKLKMLLSNDDYISPVSKQQPLDKVTSRLGGNEETLNLAEEAQIATSREFPLIQFFLKFCCRQGKESWYYVVVQGLSSCNSLEYSVFHCCEHDFSLIHTLFDAGSDRHGRFRLLYGVLVLWLARVSTQVWCSDCRWILSYHSWMASWSL